MKRSFHLLGLALFHLAAASMGTAQPAAAASVPATVQPVVIAHRGASGYLPEHTLPAVALAHGFGADYIEQDVVLTRDGVPVVLHDIEIDTVTDVAQRFPGRQRSNGHFYAIDFTLAEIKQLRVMERSDPQTGKPVFPGRFPRGQSTFFVPTLEEELQLVQGLNRSRGRVVGIYPEIKAPAWHRQQGQDISAIVLEVLARYGYRTRSDPFYLQCFDFDEVRRLREKLGFQGRLVQLIGLYGGGEVDEAGHPIAQDNRGLLAPEGLAKVARVADGIGPLMDQLVHVTDARVEANGVVERAHALGLVVHPYTFRTDALPEFGMPEQKLLAFILDTLRVDGLFTDQADVVVKYLAARPR